MVHMDTSRRSPAALARTMGPNDPAASAKSLTDIFAACMDPEARHYEFLLLLRFAMINLAGFALLGAAYLQGWIDMVLASDTTHLGVVIFAVFLAGLACAPTRCGKR